MSSGGLLQVGFISNFQDLATEKHACPGRFFASDEASIILCHVLLKYDIKLKDGNAVPVPFEMGWALFAQPSYQIMVRGREGVDEELLV